MPGWQGANPTHHAKQVQRRRDSAGSMLGGSWFSLDMVRLRINTPSLAVIFVSKDPLYTQHHAHLSLDNGTCHKKSTRARQHAMAQLDQIQFALGCHVH